MASTHKTISILAYALVEWILIIMLLFNSIFSYLIRKFATYNNLKPPCVWCSTIDHLFDPNNNASAYRKLVCEPHAIEFLNHYDCPGRLKMSPEHGSVCRNRGGSCCSKNFNAMSVDRSFDSAWKIKSNYEGNGMVELMDLPIENKGCIQVFDQIIPLEWTDSSTSCSSGLNGDEDHNQVENYEARLLQSSCRDEEDKAVMIDTLVAELKAEKLVICGLYIELDEERKASAVAANQAMAMITRLQEQKVALHIEYIQNQRMMDEQAEYDHEVLHLLNKLVTKLEKDKSELENELETYKQKVSHYDRKPKAKMMPQCPHASCSITKESLVDSSVLLDSKDLREHEESIMEFEIERLWILDEVKDLDETLMTLTTTNDLINEDHVRKTCLVGEDLGYKENTLLNRVFNMECIDEKAEASHSAWTRNKF